jgi:hypothetical protein
MSDIIDQMDERNEPITALQLAAARANAQIPAGVPGDCDFCGDWFGRLVKGACVPCREKRKLP